MEESNWYLYRHLKSCGEVFYIGIGKTKNFKRAKSKSGRSNFWKDVVNKHGYEVQILTTGKTLTEANELEKILVAWYGRRDLGKGTLVNLTDGGDGTEGFVPSEEQRKKQSDSMKGRKAYNKGVPMLEGQKKKISISKKGKEGMKGENNPNFGRCGELHPLYGIPRTKEFKETHSKIVSGANNPNAKIVLCKQTGVYYDFVGEASEAYGIKRTTLTAWLNGTLPNKSSLIYV